MKAVVTAAVKAAVTIVALVSLLGLVDAPALARRPAARTAAVKKPRPVSAPKAPAKRPGGDKSNRNNDSDGSGAKATASTAGDSDGDTVAAPPATTTGPGGKTLKTKTYTFGAMDVEGKLKTPQLLYFLDRVKLELDMSAPDKRSFIKELEKSADDSSL